MHLKNSDVFVALSIVLFNVVDLLLSYRMLWVNIVLALPLVFFVPGYMLIALLTHTRQLDVFQRLTLSLGLSLTLDILSGFLLNMLPMGLRTQSWVMLLSGLTFVFALAVLYFRRRIVYVSGREDYEDFLHTANQGASYTTRSIFWTRVRDGVIFAVAATLVILSLVYATHGVAEGPHQGFTQLWMLPPNCTAQNCAVNVGIHSFENSSVSYHTVMTINGMQTMSLPMLVLTPNQLWERSITIPPTTTKNMFVQVKLYRNDKPTVVYRKVHITLTVLMNGQGQRVC